jgi:hypothetical protein
MPNVKKILVRVVSQKDTSTLTIWVKEFRGSLGCAKHVDWEVLTIKVHHEVQVAIVFSKATFGISCRTEQLRPS